VLVGDGGDDLLNGDAGSDTFLESGVDDAYDSGSIQRGAGGDTLNGGTPTTGTLDRADYGQRSADLTITLCTDPTKPKGGSTAHSQCTDADGASESDSVVNVQHLLGGSGDDTLSGHAGDETIEGAVMTSSPAAPATTDCSATAGTTSSSAMAETTTSTASRGRTRSMATDSPTAPTATCAS
jgi:Ca2+-binding RTX toxin-like protein